MFSKNDYVIYSTEGICRVEDIRPVSFDIPHMPSEERVYYVLSPLSKSGASVYMPIENEQLVAKMRHVLTKEEIDEAIDASAKKPLPDLSDRRRRTMIYKAVTDSMKCELVLLLVRALYERRQALALEGKRMAFSDSEMLARCELSVAAEFAFALGIEKSEVGTYIQNRFEQIK